MAQENYENVRRAVERVVRERFDEINIVSITITPDHDEDGDRILLIEVVFDSSAKRLDSRKTLGLTRHLLPELHEAQECGFPVFSFIANSEIGKQKAETA